MNYNQIKNVALNYADREDANTAAAMDDFLRIVEARINRLLDIREMSQRAIISVSEEDHEYYGLPAGFSGIRSIEVKDPDVPNTRHNAQYLSNELMNMHINSSGSEVKYTIQADQFHIFPPPLIGCLIEIVYYGDLIPLSDIDPQNFMSDIYPDVYIFGLLVEISSYTKDEAAAAQWEGRFRGVVDDLSQADQVDRWSGNPLTMKVIP